MALLACASRHMLQHQQAPGILVLLRSFASAAAKDAVERTVVVDTLAQAKKLESLGMPRQQAEDLTQYMTEQIILDRIRLSEKFSAKVELEKVRGMHTAATPRWVACER
jgi:N-acyl-L-homoserine lactone synthetase